jgi:hypothetical protein
MESGSFLSVDDKPISIGQAVRYLQASGKLGQFIGDVLRQYAIEQELEKREDVTISPALTEQAIVDFRLKNQLTDPQSFQEWLTNNGTNYENFHAQ